MKHYKLFLLFFLVACFAKPIHAQENTPEHWLKAHFNRNALTNSVGLLYQIGLKRHHIYAGLKKNIFNNQYFHHSSSNSVTYQRGYAAKGFQHIGFNMGYQYALPIFAKKHQLLFYYDLEISYLSLKDKYYMFVGVDSVGHYFYRTSTSLYNPAWSFEQTFGTGLRLSLNDQLYFEGIIGVGYGIYKYDFSGIELESGLSTPRVRNFNGFVGSTEVIGLDPYPVFRLGLSYRIKKMRKD